MLDRTLIKYAIKRLLRRAGWEVSRHARFCAPDERLRELLARERVGLVLDVGASEGQYARWLRTIGYEGKIVSFEPLQVSHRALCAHAERDQGWEAAPRMAIGDQRGMLELNVSRNLMSTSALRMLPAHLAAAPQSEIIGTETVDVLTLDEAAAPYLGTDRAVFVKLDVQGMEAKVLVGATAVLHRARAIQIELSLTPLYEGQPLICDLVSMLSGAGFAPVDLYPEFTDPRTGRVLQANGVFAREANAP